MTTEPTRRYEDLNIDRRHCHEHADRCVAHENLSEAVGNVHDEVLEIRAIRKNEKYFYGVIGSIFIGVVSLCGWVFSDNLTSIRKDMETIKGFMSQASTNDTAIKGRLETIEWRLQQLEGKQ